MSPPATLALEPPAKTATGLRGVWSFFRRRVLRVAPQATPGVSAPQEENESPLEAVEPPGVRLRQTAPPAPTSTPKPHSLMQSIAEGLSAVPPLAHVVRELLHELSDPVSNARSVARFAASDPALAASLLRMVNSAAIGLRRKITSVAEAVSYLGYSVVRSMVLRMRLEQMLPTKGEQAAYDAEDLWIHSLAVSRTADCLAERIGGGLDRGLVSTLGLLHDIGKLAINSQFPSSAAALRTASKDNPEESFLDRECRILGADHAEIGSILATHWKLPPDLVTAIRFHHAPQNMPPEIAPGVRQAGIVVHLANQLAKYCYVYSENMEIDIVGEEMFKELGIAGPLARLLNGRVRSAISRAIFFADESSTRPLGALRRFLRLCTPTQAAPLLAQPRRRAMGEPRIRVHESMPQAIFGDGCPVLNHTGGRIISSAQGSWKTAPRVRFLARANAGGAAAILVSATTHQEALWLDEDVRLAARFLVRRLLAAISDIGGGIHPLELAQSLQDGRFVIGIRSRALAFSERFGLDVSPSAALSVVEEELANVLNLRWFSEIRTTPDGSTLLFISHARKR